MEEALTTFTLTSEEGNERLAINRVLQAVEALRLPRVRADRLATAVGEAVMNAIEHGNGNRASQLVGVTVLASPSTVTVRVTDRGGGDDGRHVDTPDIEAKLAGLQTPRGWGLFLMEQMVDEVRAHTTDEQHTVELVLHREEPTDAG